MKKFSHFVFVDEVECCFLVSPIDQNLYQTLNYIWPSLHLEIHLIDLLMLQEIVETLFVEGFDVGWIIVWVQVQFRYNMLEFFAVFRTFFMNISLN